MLYKYFVCGVAPYRRFYPISGLRRVILVCGLFSAIAQTQTEVTSYMKTASCHSSPIPSVVVKGGVGILHID